MKPSAKNDAESAKWGSCMSASTLMRWTPRVLFLAAVGWLLAGHYWIALFVALAAVALWI